MDSLQPEHLSSYVRCGWAAGYGARTTVQEYADGHSTGRDPVEKLMDNCQKDLPPLKEFVLPGGGKISSLLHQARTICRRAERLCVRWGREEPLDPALVRFLNRLSDTLFVLARWMAKQQSELEFLWERDPKGV
jgi:cob(I)alamin adenosyltransferase